MLAVHGRGTAHLLSTTGEWRSLPVDRSLAGPVADTGRHAAPRVAAVRARGGGDLRPRVGREAFAGSPPGLPGVGLQQLGLGRRTHRVARRPARRVAHRHPDGQVATGPYPREFAWTADPDGDGVVESTDYDEPATLSDWTTGSERRVPESATGRMQSAPGQRRDGRRNGLRPTPVLGRTANERSMHPRAVLPARPPRGLLQQRGPRPAVPPGRRHRLAAGSSDAWSKVRSASCAGTRWPATCP